MPCRVSVIFSIINLHNFVLVKLATSSIFLNHGHNKAFHLPVLKQVQHISIGENGIHLSMNPYCSMHLFMVEMVTFYCPRVNESN